MTEHRFDVPKDYSKPDGGTIRLFGRSVCKHEAFPIQPKSSSELPWLLYLQGGPGFGCRPPQQTAMTEFLLDKGYQVLYLDQRGTGLSSPITASTLQMRGYSDVQHRYMKLYRADNIVRDCEAVRKALLADLPAEKQKWSILGQSFGGFCSLTYLSFFPNGLKEVFLFGGLAPIRSSPDEVYRRLYKKVINANERYYAKYPEDVERVQAILRYLARFGDGKIKLPSEGSLTRRRFLQLGIKLGSHGGADALHNIVLRASQDIEAFGHLTRPSLGEIDCLGYDEALIYSLLHEPLYCQHEAPKWSADRLKAEFEEFDADRKTGPVYFTGEMIYRWMFEDYAELRKVADVADLLAADADWPELYDEEQLAKNDVPVYAASYEEDMYVDQELALQTAAKVRSCKVFRTNVMLHDTIRAKAEEVLRQVFALKEDLHD